MARFVAVIAAAALALVARVSAQHLDRAPAGILRGAVASESRHLASTKYDSPMGCYADSKRDRVLRRKSRSDHMTPAMCKKACSYDYYYGLQFGKECWCGDNGTDYDRHGKGKCYSPCGGDHNVKCGGVDSFSLYKNAGGQVNATNCSQYRCPSGYGHIDNAKYKACRKGGHECTAVKCCVKRS